MEHKKIQPFRGDNKGSITIEAVFVIPVMIGVIFSLIFLSIYCLDQVYVECKLREQIRSREKESVIEGILGQGSIMDDTRIDFFRSSYHVNYKIDVRYPFSSDFLGNGYRNIEVKLNICERDSCDFVRKYDALVNRE